MSKDEPEGVDIMRPIDQYDTLRRGREELLRQAEYERMIRAASFKERRQPQLLRSIASWLRTQLLSRGHKLEQPGTADPAHDRQRERMKTNSARHRAATRGP